MRPSLLPSLPLIAALLIACGSEPSGPSNFTAVDAVVTDASDVVSDLGEGVTDVAPADVALDAPLDEGGFDTEPDVPIDDATDVEITDGSGEQDAVEIDVTPDVDAGPAPIEDGAVPTFFRPEAVTRTLAFDLGVQAGAMRERSFLAWTHVTGLDSELLLRVWRPTGEDDGRILLVHDEVVEPDDSGYVHAPVTELAGGQWYNYAFYIRKDGRFEARSAVGRVRTALPAGSLEPLLIGATSCTNGRFQPWEALEALAEEPMDLFINAGDQTYNDGDETIAEYRDSWKEALTDPGYTAIYERTGMYATWDDHEVDDNWNPESLNPSILQAATQSFFETLAIEPGPTGGLWNSFTWGDTAEIFVLDCRSERLPSTRGSSDIYISPEQMAWLKNGLATSTARFKIIVNSVPITDMPTAYVSQADRWEGYPLQRSDLLNYITNEDIRNVWFIAGDFHIGMVNRVATSGRASRIHEIAVGPGGNANPVASTLTTLMRLDGTNQILWHTGSTDTEVATTMLFDPERNEVRVRFFTADGDVLYDQWLSEPE
jgi:alkaline phosphatase D